MRIQIQNIHKTFGSYKALDGVSLDIQEGELLALLGPSGSGKTTLLRLLAGLENPDPGQGSIFLDDKEVTRLGPSGRQVGFVFQHYALFRHMSVFENVAFGLRVKSRKERPSSRVIQERVHALLELVQLDGFARRFPTELSGGQRQRIALARALAVEPKFLLLDEPFGALDAKIRRDLRNWLKDLHNRVGLTTVFVTHDQEEALELSERVVILNHGRIEQVGTPEEVYFSPATPFVCEFVGEVNLLPQQLWNALGGAPSQLVNEDAKVYVRPHDLEIFPLATPQALPMQVLGVRLSGSSALVDLQDGVGGTKFQARTSHAHIRNAGLTHGQEVFVKAAQLA